MGVKVKPISASLSLHSGSLIKVVAGQTAVRFEKCRVGVEVYHRNQVSQGLGANIGIQIDVDPDRAHRLITGLRQAEFVA